MQLDLNFEAGLTTRYKTLMDVCRAAVYGNQKRQLKAIAADLDKSSSELSRMLREDLNDPRNLPVDVLSELVTATGESGKDIIYWLIEKHLDDPERQRQERLENALTLLEKIPDVLESLKELTGDVVLKVVK